MIFVVTSNETRTVQELRSAGRLTNYQRCRRYGKLDGKQMRLVSARAVPYNLVRASIDHIEVYHAKLTEDQRAHIAPFLR